MRKLTMQRSRQTAVVDHGPVLSIHGYSSSPAAPKQEKCIYLEVQAFRYLQRNKRMQKELFLFMFASSWRS
jgi:hypothetical protein